MRRLAGAAIVAALLCGSGCEIGSIGISGGVAVEGDPELPLVVFLSSSPPQALPPEEAAAWEWLQSHPDFSVAQLQMVDLAGARLPRNAVLWWHYAAETALPSVALRRESLTAVRNHLRGGGTALFSLIAATYVVPLGIESSPPDIVSTRGGVSDREAELGGHQSRWSHPLLDPSWGGAYTSSNARNATRPMVAYTGARWPVEGRVWSVHKDERHIEPATKIGVEYPSAFSTGGAVLTLGAHCYFADAGNHNRPQLETLVTDALLYLSRGTNNSAAGAATLVSDETAADVDVPSYWEPGPENAVEVEVEPTAVPERPEPEFVLNLVEGSRSGIEIARYDDSAAFTLTSARALVSGSQRGKIDEFRVHPYPLLRDLRFGIVRAGRGVTWLDAGSGSRTFTARPEGDELYYNDGEMEIWLHITVDRRYPALVGVLAVRSPAPVDVIMSWHAERAAAGPVARPQSEPLQIGWDSGAQGVVWRNGAGYTAKAGFARDSTAHILGFDPELHLDEEGLAGLDQPSADPASVALQASLAPARPALLPFAVVGGASDEIDIDGAFAELVASPGRPWVDNAAEARTFLGNRTLGLLAPDQDFADTFKWAKLGVDGLRLASPDTPGAIASGFGTVHAGEAWIATPNALGGAGALWAAMAADAYGDRGLAAETLRLAARFPGTDGRIADAISAGRDAVDNRVATTALFLIAMDNHLRTWGDVALLEELWPAAEDALGYLLSTDPDGDGLANGFSTLDRWSRDPVVQTTIHLAGLWGAALEAMQRMATVLEDDDLSTRTLEASTRVRQALNEQFWHPGERRFNFAKRSDGSFASAQTVLPAVPMAFGLLDAGIANAALDSLSSAALKRDWGVGFLSAPEPPLESATDIPELVAPMRGVPDLAAELVSPVFTGWAALAAYANHRPVAGFDHTATNLQLLKHGNVGRSGGALATDMFASRTGITHAAGSQAMTVLPVVWGMLGIRPNAPAGTITISPQLPAGWPRVIVDRVRIGESEFRLQIRKTATRTQFHIERWRGPRNVDLRLVAHVPSDVEIALDRNVTGAEIIEDELVEDSSHRLANVVVRPLPDAAAITVNFDHDEFPGLVPPAVILRGDGENGGLRVVRSRYLGGVMRIETEGLPGRTYTIRLATPWNVSQVTGVPDAQIAHPEAGTATITVSIPGSGPRYRPIDLEVTFER